MLIIIQIFLFFFNDTATTEIYTLSLHDALPIFLPDAPDGRVRGRRAPRPGRAGAHALRAHAPGCVRSRPRRAIPLARATFNGRGRGGRPGAGAARPAGSSSA